MAKPGAFDSLVSALIDAVNDKDKSVGDSAFASLTAFGIQQPSVVLSAIHAHLARHAKLAGPHRGMLLSVMNCICRDRASGGFISNDQAALIINLAAQEMTMSKETVELWQQPASELLVTLCRVETTPVMDSLLQKFQPGFTPHYYVVHTLGEIAVNNSFGFISFLCDILSRTVPLLGTLKSDILKCAFAVALRKFSESVREYIANLSQSPDPNISKETFATQFASAYDVIYAQWLKPKEAKVRSAAIECLGELCSIIPSEKLVEEIRKLTPTLLQSYGKQPDNLPITEGLCRMLEAAMSLQEVSALPTFLDEIWSTLFPQVGGMTVDYATPSAAKNQNEVLRCFHITAIKFADRLVPFMLQRLLVNSEKSKISALSILRHLVNSSGPYVEDKRSTLLHGLKPILHDSNVKVKQQMCQLIVALADHGYLSTDAGQTMIEFLLRQICFVDSKENRKKAASDPEYKSFLSLKSQCSTTLQVLSSSVQETEPVLWPFLFQFLCLETHTPALSDICSSLCVIAQRMHTQERFKLELPPSDGIALLPGPYQIFCRLFVAVSCPANRSCQPIVQLLFQLCPIFYPDLLKPLWDSAVPKLLECLEESPRASESLKLPHRNKWTNLMLKFLSRTLDTVNSEEWSCKLAGAMGQQFHLWNRYPDEKRFLFEALGGVLMKINNRQFVLDHLDLMFRACTFSVAQERQGCAIGVGFCATSHVDLVLTKLENEAKLEYQRRSTGFLGFIKDTIPVKTDNDIEIANMKALIMLCYGYVALYCPVNLLTQKLETVMLRFLTSYFENPRDAIVKEALLHSADLIAVSVHPDHLTTDYVFDKRAQMMNYIKDYLKSEPTDRLCNKVPILALHAAAAFVKLHPPLVETDIWTLCSITAQQCYPLLSSKEQEKGDALEIDPQLTVECVISAQDELFEEIIRKQPTCQTLLALLKIVQAWFSAENTTIRKRAFDSAHLLLKSYYAYADVAIGQATDFTPFGGLLAKFLPRFGDSFVGVRQRAFKCVHWTLAISVLHLGHSKLEQDNVVDGIVQLDELLEQPDLSGHLQVVIEISKIANQRLSGTHLQTYISVLFDLLLDKQDSVSCATAVLLKQTFIERGSQLFAEAEKIVSVLVSKLGEIHSVQTYAETLQALYHFTVHHLTLVTNNLLNQPLPFSQPVCDFWQALVRDSQMAPLIMSHLIEVLSTETAFDVPENSTAKYARFAPCAALSALVELMKGAEPEELIHTSFPLLLSKLLLQCGALAGTAYSRGAGGQIAVEMYRLKPLVLVQTAIKALLMRTRADAIMSTLEEHARWNDFIDDIHYVDAISEVARAIATTNTDWPEGLIAHFRLYRESHFAGHRIVCLACISELVRCSGKFRDGGDGELVEEIMAALTTGLTDSCVTVRKLSVRGMGNLVHSSDEVFSKYAAAVLSALVSGLEDFTDLQEDIALESMNGLGKIITRLNDEHINTELGNILLRIKIFFEKESAAVRTVSITLFGQLSKFGRTEVYENQLHSNLITFLLHLNDDVQEVRKACAFTLSAVAPFLGALKLSTLLERLADDKKSPKYREFLSQCSKDCVEGFPDRVNFYAMATVAYFRSSAVHIRCNAALFIGYLLGAVPDLHRNKISIDSVFNGLTDLLKDSDAEVRLCAADAVAYLSSY